VSSFAKASVDSASAMLRLSWLANRNCYVTPQLSRQPKPQSVERALACAAGFFAIKIPQILIVSRKMVRDAVYSERVSVYSYPAIRELTGKIGIFSPKTDGC